MLIGCLLAASLHHSLIDQSPSMFELKCISPASCGALPKVYSLGYEMRLCLVLQSFRSCGGAFPWILWMRRK